MYHNTKILLRLFSLLLRISHRFEGFAIDGVYGDRLRGLLVLLGQTSESGQPRPGLDLQSHQRPQPFLAPRINILTVGGRQRYSTTTKNNSTNRHKKSCSTAVLTASFGFWLAWARQMPALLSSINSWLAKRDRRTNKEQATTTTTSEARDVHSPYLYIICLFLLSVWWSASRVVLPPPPSLAHSKKTSSLVCLR